MAIPFRCQCGKTIKAKDEMAGKKFRCPDCGKAMQVPEPEAFEEDPFETREDDFEEERRPAPRRRSSSGSKPRKAPAKSSNHGLIFGLAAAALAFALVIGGAVFVVARQPKQQPVANNPPIQMPNRPRVAARRARKRREPRGRSWRVSLPRPCSFVVAAPNS